MRSMLQRSTTISAASDHAAALVEILFCAKKYQSAATSMTKAKERQAPRKSARELASTRSVRRGSANDSAIEVSPPNDANTAMAPPNISQPTMYLRDLQPQKSLGSRTRQ